MKRTAQHILAERRYAVQEQRKERDQLSRAILQHEINLLDNELKELTGCSPDRLPLEVSR